MIGGEKEICGGYSQPNTPNNSMKTHMLKHRRERRREKNRYIRGGYSQPNKVLPA